MKPSRWIYIGDTERVSRCPAREARDPCSFNEVCPGFVDGDCKININGDPIPDKQHLFAYINRRK